MQRLLDGAKQRFTPGAVADFTFMSRETVGESWLAVGDSAGFIDPLFSSGAHVAMVGAHRAADALHAALDAGDLTPEQFQAWVRTMKRGTKIFIGAVQAFYDGRLITYLFAPNKREYLTRAITSMLAGDVFEEARWSNDHRKPPASPHSSRASRGSRSPRLGAGGRGENPGFQLSF